MQPLCTEKGEKHVAFRLPAPGLLDNFLPPCTWGSAGVDSHTQTRRRKLRSFHPFSVACRALICENNNNKLHGRLAFVCAVSSPFCCPDSLTPPPVRAEVHGDHKLKGDRNATVPIGSSG